VGRAIRRAGAAASISNQMRNGLGDQIAAISGRE
jgi:hypothetical protein